MSALDRLQRWYAARCDGTWEHDHGVTITSCDNPGWWVKVALAGTPLHGIAFAEIALGVDGQRHPAQPSWLSCRVEDDAWHGAGDAAKLEVILEAFLDWAERHGTR
jgi:hypothetical protein